MKVPRHYSRNLLGFGTKFLCQFARVPLPFINPVAYHLFNFFTDFPGLLLFPIFHFYLLGLHRLALVFP
jgi:hypothetical protein